MCPEFERVERIVQLMVDGCEKVGALQHGSRAERRSLIRMGIDIRPVIGIEVPLRRVHGQKISAVCCWL